ncbi:hypothetical protein RUM43_001528 [Polyplax serrata]|uniref:Uncharacterized protein n=1 Tax=Polyplax serrata TaxID=468196 RepID=A0AAN8XU30_POLSC
MAVTIYQTNTQTTKKKTTFSKFLRGLKTVHRKEKHGSSSRRHDRDPRFHGGNSSQRNRMNMEKTSKDGRFKVLNLSSLIELVGIRI